MSSDKCNRLVLVEDNLGVAIEYTYDCLNNRLIERARINDEKYSLMRYTYDAAGRMIESIETVDYPDIGEEPKSYKKK